MKLRKTLAGLVVAGSVVGGFAGLASAQTAANPPAPPTAHTFSCDTAKDHLVRLQKRVDVIKGQIAKAEARIDQLRKEGHNDRADALAKRVERAKDRLAKAEARIDTVTKRINEHCGDPNATASSNSSSSSSSATP
jgi:chaperonin cofactor prefoldin